MNKKEKAKLSKKYEAAWHFLFFKLPDWKQKEVIANPEGHTASELAHEVSLAVDKDEPEMVVSGSLP